jgi:hypothetical protein
VRPGDLVMEFTPRSAGALAIDALPRPPDGIDQASAGRFVAYRAPFPTLQVMCVVGRDERHVTFRQRGPRVVAAMTETAIAIRQPSSIL